MVGKVVTVAGVVDVIAGLWYVMSVIGYAPAIPVLVVSAIRTPCPDEGLAVLKC